jgi:hypothetical protein
MRDTLTIDHNAGFFSCCSVKLTKIIEYFNINKKEPGKIICSNQFQNYKINPYDPNEDLTHLFFRTPSFRHPIEYVAPVDFFWEHQFIPYKDLKFKYINQFIKKYFEPSKTIFDSISKTEIKYNINYDNLISVCYRGNDKHNETNIASYEQFFSKCHQLKIENPDCNFFVQTDELEFLNKFCKIFANTFYLKEIPIINQNKYRVIHHLIDQNDRPTFGCRILKSIYMLSKCKHVVTHSGNCGMWIALFRGNAKNLHQYLNHQNTKLGWINIEK